MKKAGLLILAVCLVVAALVILPIHGEQKIYNSVIRLHVLANSDSEEDQALKLRVRDAVLTFTGTLLRDVTTRGEAETALNGALGDIQAVAAQAAAAAGDHSPITVTLGQELYPTRTYESLAFPAGEYLSLRVMIGEAAGKNWWCVLFPPLCLSAAVAKRDAEEAFLAAGLSGEQYRIITDTQQTKYKLRFKILEWLQP